MDIKELKNKIELISQLRNKRNYTNIRKAYKSLQDQSVQLNKEGEIIKTLLVQILDLLKDIQVEYDKGGIFPSLHFYYEFKALGKTCYFSKQANAAICSMLLSTDRLHYALKDPYIPEGISFQILENLITLDLKPVLQDLEIFLSKP